MYGKINNTSNNFRVNKTKFLKSKHILTYYVSLDLLSIPEISTMIVNTNDIDWSYFKYYN